MIRRHAKVILPFAQVTFVLSFLLAMADVGNPYVMYGILLASFGVTFALVDHPK